MADSLIDVVNLDYDTLFAEAVNQKDKFPELADWDIENENDPLRVILDAYLLGIVKLGKFANNISQEFSLSTAITRDSITDKAFFAGYVVSARLAALGELQLVFNAGDPVTIEPGELILSGRAENGQRIFIENANAIVLGPVATTLDNVEFVEGRTFTLPFTGKNEPFETFLIQDTVIDQSISLVVNGTEWSEVFRINEDYSSTAEVFTVREVGEELYQISVGNGVNGALIPRDASVSLVYRRGAGFDGNQPASIFTKIEAIPTGRLASVGPASGVTDFSGGVNEEDLEKIRTFAPIVPKLGDRIANPFDMDAFVNSFPGIGRGKTASLAGNSVIVFVIAEVGVVSDSLSNDLLAAINSRVIFNIGVGIQEAARVPVDITLDVIYTSQFRAQDVETQIRNNILNFLNPFSQDEFGEFLLDFGSDLLSSNVIELAQQVPGVVAVSISDPTAFSDQILIQIADNEILTNDGSVINVNLTRIEAADNTGNRNDKFLFTNPRNRTQ